MVPLICLAVDMDCWLGALALLRVSSSRLEWFPYVATSGKLFKRGKVEAIKPHEALALELTLSLLPYSTGQNNSQGQPGFKGMGVEK